MVSSASALWFRVPQAALSELEREAPDLLFIYDEHRKRRRHLFNTQFDILLYNLTGS